MLTQQDGYFGLPEEITVSGGVSQTGSHGGDLEPPNISWNRRQAQTAYPQISLARKMRWGKWITVYSDIRVSTSGGHMGKVKQILDAVAHSLHWESLPLPFSSASAG